MPDFRVTIMMEDGRERWELNVDAPNRAQAIAKVLRRERFASEDGISMAHAAPIRANGLTDAERERYQARARRRRRAERTDAQARAQGHGPAALR